LHIIIILHNDYNNMFCYENEAKIKFMSNNKQFSLLVLYGSYAHFMKGWYPYRDMETVLNIQYEEMKKVGLIIYSCFKNKKIV